MLRLEEIQFIKVQNPALNPAILKDLVRYEEIFRRLWESKVLDTKNGQVVLHFNEAGKLAKIEKNEVVFRA